MRWEMKIGKILTTRRMRFEERMVLEVVISKVIVAMITIA